MHEIFISYRREDSNAWALILRDALVASFGEEHVYLDRDTQRAGNWREQIKAGISRSRVVLVLIGSNWLDATTKEGVLRLSLPDDVHRQEIASALATRGVLVIPIRLDGAELPTADALSDDLKALVDQQWRDVAASSSHRKLDLSLLVRDIEKATGLVAWPLAPARGPWQSRIRLVFLGLVTTLGVVVTVDQWMGWKALDAVETTLVFIVVLLLLIGARGTLRRVRKPG